MTQRTAGRAPSPAAWPCLPPVLDTSRATEVSDQGGGPAEQGVGAGREGG